MKKKNHILRMVISILIMASISHICNGQATTSKHRKLNKKDNIPQRFLEFMSETEYIRIFTVADNTDIEISKAKADSISEQNLCKRLKTHLDSLYAYHLRNGNIESSIINDYKYGMLSEIYINEAIKQSDVHSLTKKTNENMYSTYLLLELYTPEIFHAWDKQFVNQMDTLLLRQNFTYEVFMEIFHEEFKKMENKHYDTIKATYTYEDIINQLIEELEESASEEFDEKMIEEIKIKFQQDLKAMRQAFYEDFKKALQKKIEQDSIERVMYKQFQKTFLQEMEKVKQ